MAQVMGSVAFVTTLNPLDIMDKPTNMAAEITKAAMTEGILAFSLAPKK